MKRLKRHFEKEGIPAAQEYLRAKGHAVVAQEPVRSGFTIQDAGLLKLVASRGGERPPVWSHRYDCGCRLQMSDVRFSGIAPCETHRGALKHTSP